PRRPHRALGARVLRPHAGGRAAHAHRRPEPARPSGPERLRSIAAVLGPVRHIADLARSAATRGSRARDDAEALRELECQAVDLPDGLSIQWLGVSGYRLDFESHSLYVDPYVS